MDAALNRKSLAIGVPGLIIQFAGVLLPMVMGVAEQPDHPAHLYGTVIMFAGLIMLIVGLGLYASAKGYSRYMGLLGLLSILGLIILAVLPDKLKTANPTA